MKPIGLSAVMAYLGKRGGSKTSPAKRAAARANIKKAWRARRRQAKQARKSGA
jgi:hypothetical protein